MSAAPPRLQAMDASRPPWHSVHGEVSELRWSASIMSWQIPFLFTGHIGKKAGAALYGAGILLSPEAVNAALQCAYAGDAATLQNGCDGHHSFSPFLPAQLEEMLREYHARVGHCRSGDCCTCCS